MKRIFVPIIKTKRNAEVPLVKTYVNWMIEHDIMPYFEFVKRHNEINKEFNTAIGAIRHFEEMLEKDISKDIDSAINYFSMQEEVQNTIQSFKLQGDEEVLPEALTRYIQDRASSGLSSAIRVLAGTKSSLLNDISKKISSNDFVVIDLGDTEYDAVFYYLDMVRTIIPMEQIVVISREIPRKISAKEYHDRVFEKNLLNTSLIKAIKDGSFPFIFFGTHASAKDDLSEEGRAQKVYGRFLIFDFDKAEYYCIKSDTAEHISKVYNQIREKISEADIETFFSRTPLSKEMLEDYKKDTSRNATSSGFLKISIMHYIEEVVLSL